MSILKSHYLLKGLVAVAALLAINSAGAAAITTYNSLATWQAAAGSPIVVEDFADATLVSGLTITFGTNSPPGSISGGAYHDTAVTQFNDAKNPKLGFTPGTFAVGADWDLSPGGAGDGLVLFLTFADLTTSSLTISNPLPNPFVGFFGLVSDTAVTSIRLDSPATGVEAFDIDNLRFRGVGSTAIPLPGTLMLFLAAGLGLLGVRRWTV